MDRLETGVVETGAVTAPIDAAFPPPVVPIRLGRSGQRRVLAAAVTSWTLMVVGTFGITPVHPDIARDLGFKADAFGAVLGIATVVAGTLQIPIGLLADRFRVKYWPPSDWLRRPRR